MVLQNNKFCSNKFLDVFNLLNMTAALLLCSFLLCELSTTVEGRSVTTMNATKNVTLVSKAGRYLTIGIQAITGEYTASPYAKLEMHTVGFNGEIRIKGVKTGKYLAIDSTGTVSLVASVTKEAVFIDLRKITSPFSFIKSKAHPSRYLAISGTGAVSGTTKTNSDDAKFVHFPAT